MWMMVMFDLPVTTKEERSRATKFRKYLMDEGFEMSQFSVYYRFIGAREKATPFVKRIKSEVPRYGVVSILFFTDKQFGDIITLRNCRPEKTPEQPSLFDLF